MGSAPVRERSQTSSAMIEQARRGRGVVNSGVGERIADIFIGGALVAGARRLRAAPAAPDGGEFGATHALVWGTPRGR